MLSLHRLLSLALLLGSLTAASDLQAQNVYGRSYGAGYGFGLGAQAPFFVGNFGYVRPSEELPYFAKFPPVYYSHIVPRPYGVSPYAVPPGIAPTEYMVQPLAQPEVIRNPYVDQAPAAETEEAPAVDVEAPRAMIESKDAADAAKPADREQPRRRRN
jgi:hypothetical protein